MRNSVHMEVLATLTAKAILKDDEGFRSMLYKDTHGKNTIGYGHNLDVNPISRNVAELMLSEDIQAKYDELVKSLPWIITLDPVRQSVLLCMAFQMGVEGLLGFHNTLELVRNGKFEEASQEMLKSTWGSEFSARAYRLALRMETGKNESSDTKAGS